MASVRPALAIAVAITVVVLFVVVSPSHAQTACERARGREGRFKLGVQYRCDKAGNYFPLQRTRQGSFCVTPQGQVVSSPSREVRTCVCPLAANSAKKEGKKTVPQCDATGRFRQQQRDGTSKTCVDPNTGEVTKGPVPGDQAIDC